MGWHEIRRASLQVAAALSSAEEARRAKDNFLATISHELRNPLNSIMLSSGILLSDPALQENARQKVKAIERTARTQAQLIEDLLDVSRIESGRMRLDVQATDLAQVVKAAVDAMQVAAEAKSIDLQEHYRSERQSDRWRPPTPATSGLESAFQRGEVHAKRGQGSGSARENKFPRRDLRGRQWTGDRVPVALSRV
jgi:signal transduction histidine kinase